MARLVVFLFGFIAAWGRIACENFTDYDNYTLIQLFPRNEDQVKTISQFKDPEDKIELMKSSRGSNDSLDLLVPPYMMDFVKEFAKNGNLEYKVKHRNYGRMLVQEERVPRRRAMQGFNIFQYNSFLDIDEFIETVAKRHPDLVTLEALGKSYLGRDMKLVKISANPRAGNPVIFIDAGIHAREWVAPAMALYLIHRLTSDPIAKQHELDGVDWFILPLVNPDGYEYTRSSISNRLWRKTRSKNGNCYGVDGNRNYGFKWAVSGVSKNPCNKETFAGPKPFSEPETRMVRNIMMSNAKRIKLYVSLHAYGQYLVYPWGYTGDFLPKEWKKLDDMARAVSDTVQRAGGQPFKVLSAGKWYPAAGGSDDFAFGAAGVPYSYTMELTNSYEFVYPEYLLKKVLPQFYEGFRMFGVRIKREFGGRQINHKTHDKAGRSLRN